MRKEELKRVIESLLFVHQHPLTVDNIVRIVGDQADKKVIKELLSGTRGRISRVWRGAFTWWRWTRGTSSAPRPSMPPGSGTCRKVKPARLSQSALETLAIVAYRQPIVRAEVEQIRGVDSGWVLNSLLEKGLIKILGRKEVAGRPLVYGTSRRFLEVFGLRDLSGLPTIQELDALREEEGAEHQEGEIPKEEA